MQTNQYLNQLLRLLAAAGVAGSLAGFAAPAPVAKPKPTPRRAADKPAAAPAPRHTFTLGTDQFLLDGKPLQMISGELHYPRIPREAWRARLKWPRPWA